MKFKIKGREIISLLRKETIENALGSMMGSKVRVGHKDATEHGSVNAVGRDSDSGWFTCAGETETKDAVDAIKSGQRVSCAYRVNSTGPGGTLNNVPYDEEITDISFTHLAIVGIDDARYEDATIVLNSKSSDTTMSKIKTALKWVIKKVTGDQVVEQTGEIPADDTRLNSLVELYRAKNKPASTVPDGAFIEIDGKQVPMADLMALEIENSKPTETDAEKATRLQAEEDERLNAKRQGYNEFLKVAGAKGRGQSEPVDEVEFLSPDTMDIKIQRGRSEFGRKHLAGKN